jgi:hypothetical protein
MTLIIGMRRQVALSHLDGPGAWRAVNIARLVG